MRYTYLYARYLCSRDALGLKAGRPSAARDDRVSCIQYTYLLACAIQLYTSYSDDRSFPVQSCIFYIAAPRASD